MEKMRTRDASGALREANGNRSRETVTIPAGTGVVPPNMVLGKVTATEHFIPSPNAVVAGKEGAESACAVNIYQVDATTEDREVVVWDNDCELNGKMLVYDDSVNDDTKKLAKDKQLKAKSGIKVR